MTKSIETYLPVFTGFYGTIFDGDLEEDNQIYNINEDREELKLEPITSDDCTFDYVEYRKDVAQQACTYIEKELNDIFTNKISITYQDIHSPKEYNFTSDSINIAIEIKKGFKAELLKYLAENNEAFTIYIKERFTSYDGFISRYSNYYIEWINVYFKELETKPMILGTLLDFVCENEDINTDGMYDSMTDLSIEVTNYEELTNK